MQARMNYSGVFVTSYKEMCGVRCEVFTAVKILLHVSWVATPQGDGSSLVI